MTERVFDQWLQEQGRHQAVERSGVDILLEAETVGQSLALARLTVKVNCVCQAGQAAIGQHVQQIRKQTRFVTPGRAHGSKSSCPGRSEEVLNDFLMGRCQDPSRFWVPISNEGEVGRPLGFISLWCGFETFHLTLRYNYLGPDSGHVGSVSMNA